MPTIKTYDAAGATSARELIGESGYFLNSTDDGYTIETVDDGSTRTERLYHDLTYVSYSEYDYTAVTSAVFSGIDPKSREPYVYLETLGGGMGARYTKNGKSGVQVHITNASNLPVEAIEMECPLRVQEYSLRAGSGGKGAQNGGDGLRRVIKPIGYDLKFSGAGERFSYHPWGLDGGEPGKTGQFRLIDPKGHEAILPSKTLDTPVAAGSSVMIDTPGGGGYGKR